MSIVAITVLDKMEAILNLAAILDLRKLAKSSYHLSQWIFTDIKSEKHLEKRKANNCLSGIHHFRQNGGHFGFGCHLGF